MNFSNIRTACHNLFMTDKIALSVIMLSIEGMAQISAQNVG